MDYIIGAVAGIVLGGIVGALKRLCIWNRYEKSSKENGSYDAGAGTIYARAMISYFVNIATLLIVFLIRNIVPFDGIAFLVGVAMTLAIMNHMWAFKQKSV